MKKIRVKVVGMLNLEPECVVDVLTAQMNNEYARVSFKNVTADTEYIYLKNSWFIDNNTMEKNDDIITRFYQIESVECESKPSECTRAIFDVRTKNLTLI